MFSKKVISIDVGVQNIKIVLGKHRKGIINIEKAFLVPTPKDSYEDGKLLKPDPIKDCIRQALKENRVKANKIIFTIESSLAITREVVLPQVKSGELKTMVQFEIEQFLPIDFNEYDVRYRILEEFSVNGIKNSRILVAALPQNIVLSYLDLIKDLKLKPIALDIHPNAISKLFGIHTQIEGENYSLNETVAVIDIGYSYTSVNIINKGLLGFNRIIQSGGKNLTMDIANSYGITFEEAEEKKKEFGDLEISEDELVHGTIINESMKGNVATLIEEIQTVFRFYTSRRPGNNINKIYIYGGSSRIKNLDKLMEKYINIPTHNIRLMDNIKILSHIKGSELCYFLNSIAALIRR